MSKMPAALRFSLCCCFGLLNAVDASAEKFDSPELYLSPKEFFELDQSLQIEEAILFDGASLECTDEAHCCVQDGDRQAARIRMLEAEIAALQTRIGEQTRALDAARAALATFLAGSDPGVANVAALIAAQNEYNATKALQEAGARRRPVDEAAQRELAREAARQLAEVNRLLALTRGQPARARYENLKNTIATAERALAASTMAVQRKTATLETLRSAPQCAEQSGKIEVHEETFTSIAVENTLNDSMVKSLDVRSKSRFENLEEFSK